VIRSIALISAVVLVVGSALADTTPETSTSDPETVAVDRVMLEASVRRGLEFLYESQNGDGSWGSARKTKGLNIYAPVPGAHHAFRAGTTALALGALIDCSELVEVDEAVIERGEAWILANLPKLRRADAEALYNIWGHGLGLEVLARMASRHAGQPATLAEIKKAMAEQVDLLERFSMVNGGWGYYDFAHHTKQPGGSPTSFTTATVLVGLARAREWDIVIPEPLIRRALRSISRQQIPDGSFAYGEYLKMRPRSSINRPAGSLGRSLACFVAQHEWDDPGVDYPDDFNVWLNRLFDRNLWFDIGRKRPIPHESYFGVAGYFFYYGHYYGGLAIEALPADQRSVHQGRMAGILTRLQEADGSWWDYPLYDYHQAYGTGFALQTLIRCHPDWNPDRLLKAD